MGHVPEQFECISGTSLVWGSIGSSSDAWQVIRENDELHLVFEFMEVLDAVTMPSVNLCFLMFFMSSCDTWGTFVQANLYEFMKSRVRMLRGLSQDAKVAVLAMQVAKNR